MSQHSCAHVPPGPLSLLLLGLGLLLGCLGGPTLRPAAKDLQQAIHTHTELTGAQPLFYVATVREGNLETLYAITIGNRQAAAVLTLNTSDLRPNEIAPIGIDPAGFLITAGIQSQPRGTIQVFDLRKGKAKKAIGASITEEPWSIAHYAPQQLLLGSREVDGILEWQLRYQKEEPLRWSFPADWRPSSVFGLSSSGEVLFAHDTANASALYALDVAAAQLPDPYPPAPVATFPARLIGVLQTSGSEGAGYGLVTAPGATSETTLYRWTRDAPPEPVRAFPTRGTTGLVPPGWPPFAEVEHCVVAIPARPEDAIDPHGAIYLVDREGVRRIQEANATCAWLIEPGHLCWIADGNLWYRRLDEPEDSASLLLELPPQRAALCFPAIWPTRDIPAP